MTYVYFLADERTASAGFALVKIGRSDSPDVRASQLQTGNGRALTEILEASLSIFIDTRQE